MRAFTSPDGIHWGVEARAPGASNVMIVFHYPDKESARRSRYAWLNWEGPEARNVTARLDPKTIVEKLDEEDLALLFRRSMQISAPDRIPRTPKRAGIGR
jgi:hypothetical protein